MMEDGLTAFNPKNRQVFSVSVVSSRGATSDLKPERLAKIFDIPIEVALHTMRVTNRDFPRNTTDIPLNVRNNQDDQLLRYGRLNWPLYTDTSFAVATRGKKTKQGKSGTSMRGNTCFQAFGTDFGWVGFYPLVKRKEVNLAMKKLFRKYGVPEKIYMDPAKEQVSGETLKYCNSLGCELIGTESGIPCKRAEAVIRRFKDRIIIIVAHHNLF